MHPSNQYLKKYSVIGNVRKYEQKKWNFLCEIDVYRQEKSDICYKSDDVRQSDSRNRENTAEKRLVTKKRSSEILGIKMEIFS